MLGRRRRGGPVGWSAGLHLLIRRRLAADLAYRCRLHLHLTPRPKASADNVCQNRRLAHLHFRAHLQQIGRHVYLEVISILSRPK